MRVFVAGASGVIGRALVPPLVAAGHEVTGTTRVPERAERLRAAGAQAAVCDAHDAAALRDAVCAAEPDVVVHLLTALPQRLDPRVKGVYEPTNRIRREGTANLLAAAHAAGARRIVCHSIAFAYVPGDVPDVKDEDAPLLVEAGPPFGDVVRALAHMEHAVLSEPEGIVLRYGWFYGPGTWYGDGGAIREDVRRRRFPIIGKGAGLFSFVHVDDAASATVAAIESGATGVYNVVDDEPAPMNEWLPGYAAAIGARPPLRVPVWIARLLAGPQAAAIGAQAGASNARVKRELGWSPRWASWREGFRDAPR